MSAVRSIPSAEWEAHKADISVLYLAEKKTLVEVMKIMEDDHGFCASKAQYVRKLKQWGIEKNLTSNKWKSAATQIEKRKLEGKDTQILINGQPISAKKLKKETLRYACPQFRTGEEPVDVTGAIVARTPPAEMVGDVEYTHIPWFQFQDLVESYIKLMSTPIALDKYKSFVLPSGPPIPTTMDVGSDVWDLSNPILTPSWTGWDSVIDVSWDSIHGPFQSMSSDQPSLDRQPTLRATRSAASPALEQINREARRLLGECLDEPIDPDSPEYVSRITSSLENIAVERHSGDLARHVQTLYGKSTVDASFQLLRYAVYLSSNNMLSGPNTDKLLAWVIQNGIFWVIECLIEKRTPTTEIFASNLLVSAARIEEVDAVRALLASGADPNSFATAMGNNTALWAATIKGNTLIISLLLNAGADPNIYNPDLAHSPLQVASTGFYRNTANAKLLIEGGANVNPPVADWALCPTTLLIGVVQDGDIELLRILLRAGARVNETTIKSGTALQAAAQCGNIEIAEVLLNAGVDVDSPMGWAHKVESEEAAEKCCYSFFSTPLQCAAAKDNTEMVQILLEAGADVNGFPAEDYVGWLRDTREWDDDDDYYYEFDEYYVYWPDSLKTALQEAVLNNNIVLVRLLLSLGADVNAMGAQGTALQIASENPERLKILQLLLTKGADVNSPAQVPGSRTALQAAAGSGNEEVVQHLLNGGAEANAPPNHHHGRTAVQAATESENLYLVKLLVDAGADVNARAAPRYGRTCLQTAAETGDLRMLNLLLQLGAQVNAPASLERGGRTALQAAVEGGHVSLAERLLEKGADVNGPPSPEDGAVALCDAIRNRRYELARLLLDKGADPNGYPTRTTPLEISVKLSAVEMVRCLIEAGADANGRYGRSHYDSNRIPLVIAARTGNTEIVRILIDAKANIHDTSGRKSLQNAVLENSTDIVELLLSNGVNPNQPSGSQEESALQFAVSRWPTDESMVQILVDHGADVNANYNGDYILQTAAAKGCVQIVQILLKAGADVNAPALGLRSKTALQGAARTRNIDLVTTLLDSGADINAPPSPRWGTTALQAAVSCGDVHVVQFLLSQGADVNGPAGKSNGATALQVAAANGHLGIALMLLKKGADINAAPATLGGRTALDGAAEHGHLDLVCLLLRNDKDEETIEVRCKRAAKLASSEGHLILAKLLRGWKRP